MSENAITLSPSSALARLAPRGAESAAHKRGYLSFRLGAESYCIDILKVQEIRNFAEPTRIAGAPPYIRGVIELRGTIVPIVDLRLKLGLTQAREDAQTVVIVLNLQRGAVGIVADAVREVVELAPDEVRPAPGFNARVPADFIVGLTQQQGPQGGTELLIVTDIERLITEDVFGLAEAGEPAAAAA